MPWLGGRDRRHSIRRPYESQERSEPTYLVERDAPSGPPLDPTIRWFRRAVERFRKPTYDAYPDREVPWHVVGPPGPAVPIKPEKPRQKSGKRPVSLFVKRHGKMREVKLLGLPIDIAVDRLNRRLMAGWVMNEIANTLAEMEEEEMKVDTLLEHRRRDNEGQGLAEYALILALIAIVAIVALLLLGGQVSQLLTNLANCLPDGVC